MSDLKDAKYFIVRAGNSAPPPFPVGANPEGEPVDNVISGGRSHVVSPPFGSAPIMPLRRIPFLDLLSFMTD